MGKVILLIIVSLIALSGCTQTDAVVSINPTAPAPTANAYVSGTDEVRDINWIEKDKYDISPEVARFVTITNMELYCRLYDAIDNLEDSVNISGYSSDQLDDIINALWHKSNAEFFYLTIGEYEPIRVEGTTVMIEYGYDKETIRQMKKDFATEVNNILNTIADTSESALYNEIAIYTYLERSCTYNYNDPERAEGKEEFLKKVNSASEAEKEELYRELMDFLGDPMEISNTIDAYSVLVNKTGICFGFAGALTYLYNKLDIDCLTVGSVPPNHAWNIICIDGEWYHLDLTYEITNQTDALRYLNITDSERQKDGYTAWTETYADEELNLMESCTDTRFQSLRGATSFSIEDGVLKYTTADGEQSLPLK